MCDFRLPPPVDENCAPPGYNTVSSGNFLPKFQNDLWKMGPTDHPKTLVRNYHYSQCSNPEECRSLSPFKILHGQQQSHIHVEKLHDCGTSIFHTNGRRKQI
jgi:hypothetical protein